MARLAFIDRASDAIGQRRKQHERKRRLASRERQGRKTIILKSVCVVVTLLVFLGLGLVVGTSDYEVTLIGWIPFFMALSGIILAAVYLVVLARGFQYEERLIASECERDSEIPISVTFKNKSILLATRVRVTFFIADMFGNVANEVSTSLSLSPFESYELSFGARFEHIGTYHAGLERIVVSDFLGLFTKVIENHSSQVVHVTPKYVELDTIQFSNEAMDEATQAAKSALADSMDYAYVREYEMGDPLKTIHWKLSARSGTYMTRLFEVFTRPSVVIVMDFYADNDEAEEMMSMFDAVVESAFSISRYARSQGMDVEIRYRDKHDDDAVVVSSLGREKVVDIISTLPVMSNDPKDASAAINILNKAASAARGFNNVFVCSADVGSEMVSAVVDAKLHRRTPTMVAVVPPSLVGKEREDYCASLGRLEDVGVASIALARSEELVGLGGA